MSAALASACCASPEVIGVRYDPRFEVQKRGRVALFGAVLEGDPVWAYGSPQAAVAEVSSHYRVGSGVEVGAPGEAPAQLQAALSEAELALAARGYRLITASEEGSPQAYFSVSLGTREGRLVRVALHVGGEHEGVFAPRAISFVVGEGEDSEPCPLELKALIWDLVEALPSADPPQGS